MSSRLPGLRIKIISPSSRRQMTRGIGLPVALQVNVASSPSCTAKSADDSSLMMSGGTARQADTQYMKTWRRYIYTHIYRYIHERVVYTKWRWRLSCSEKNAQDYTWLKRIAKVKWHWYCWLFMAHKLLWRFSIFSSFFLVQIIK